MIIRNKNIVKLERLVSDNSPLILTAVGVVGTVTTAVLTGKASIKAFEDTHAVSHEDEIIALNLTKVEVVKRVWKHFIPAVATGSLTIAAIVGANRIGTRRAAALASVYAVTEKAYAEYKDKVIETIGEKKEQKVRDEIAQDRVSKLPGANEVIIMGTDVLCCDLLSGRYFESTMEDLKKAQNDLNYRILNDSYASLSDFYNLIGLSSTKYSEETGWRSYEPLELQFSTTLADDMRPCLAISFNIEPIRNYYKVN